MDSSGLITTARRFLARKSRVLTVLELTLGIALASSVVQP